MKTILVCSLALGLIFTLSLTPTKSLSFNFKPILAEDRYCHYDGYTTSYLEVSEDKVISYYKSPISPNTRRRLMFDVFLIYESNHEIFLANNLSTTSPESMWYRLIPLKLAATGFIESFSFQGEFYSLNFCELE